MEGFHTRVGDAGLRLLGEDAPRRVVAGFAEEFVRRRLRLGPQRTAVGFVGEVTGGEVGWPAGTRRGWLLVPEAQGVDPVVVDAASFEALCREFDAARRAIEWPHLFRPDPVADTPAPGERERMAALERAWVLARRGPQDGRARVLRQVEGAWTADAVYAGSAAEALAAWGFGALVRLFAAVPRARALCTRLAQAGAYEAPPGLVGMPVAIELIEEDAPDLEEVALAFFARPLAPGDAGETAVADRLVRWRRERPGPPTVLGWAPFEGGEPLGEEVP